MSTAYECDKCRKLFKATLGCLTLETICVANGKPSGEMDTWSEIELCQKCSAEVLALLSPAMEGLEATLSGRSEAKVVAEKSPTPSSSATEKSS